MKYVYDTSRKLIIALVKVKEHSI